MTILIPPDVWWQAALAIVAGLLGTALGIFAMHRAWRHHDTRAERDFNIGLIVHLVGISWVILGTAILFGVGASPAQEDAVQQVVVFTNAAVRFAVGILAAHVMWDLWRCWQKRRA